MFHNRVAAVAAAGVLLSLGSGAGAGAAADGTAESAEIVERQTFGRDQIVAQGHEKRSATAQRVAQEHIDKMARMGRLVDATQVHVAEVGEGVAVWEDGMNVTGIERASILTADGKRATEVTLDAADDLDVLESAPTSTVGTGMDVANWYSGATRRWERCWGYSVPEDDEYVNDCRHIYVPHNDGSWARDYFIYHRFGDADAHNRNNYLDNSVEYFDMVSRPAASDPNRIKGMVDWFPKTQTNLCNEGGSVTFGFESAKISIPLSGCTNKTPYVRSGEKKMGMIYDGCDSGDPSCWSYQTHTYLDYTQVVYTDRDVNPAMGYKFFVRFGEPDGYDNTKLVKRNY